jgi:hypothetical protein
VTPLVHVTVPLSIAPLSGVPVSAAPVSAVLLSVAPLSTEEPLVLPEVPLSIEEPLVLPEVPLSIEEPLVLPEVPLSLLPTVHIAWGVPALTHVSNAAICAAIGCRLPTGGMGAVVLCIRATLNTATLSEGIVLLGATRSA